MCNGLILCCLWSSSPFVYYVCDPVTRQWIILPRSKCKSPYQLFFGEGLITRVNELQDHMVTDYTVVRLKVPDSRSNYFKLETFSSQTGEWASHRLKLPCDGPIRLVVVDGGAPIHSYGAFHWLTHNHGLVAFDPYKNPKSVRLIPLPSDRDLEIDYNHNGIFQLCGECQGILRYFEVADDLLRMWVTKDYEKGEWRCEFKVSRSDLHCSDLELMNLCFLERTFVPVSFHPLNLNIVYLRCIGLEKIVSYDVLNRSLDVVCELNGFLEDEGNVSWRKVIPFVLPRWPQPLPTTPRYAAPPPPPPRPRLTRS